MRALDASLLAPILYTRPTLVCSAKGGMVVMKMMGKEEEEEEYDGVELEEVGLTANLSLTLGTKTLTTHATLLSP